MKIRLVDATRAQTVARREWVRPYEDPEWQADAFAAAVLMPRKSFSSAFRGERGGDVAGALAKTFGVSRSAVKTRLDLLHKNRWL